MSHSAMHRNDTPSRGNRLADKKPARGQEKKLVKTAKTCATWNENEAGATQSPPTRTSVLLNSRFYPTHASSLVLLNMRLG